MDAEIVLDQNDGLGVREVDVGQVFQDGGYAETSGLQPVAALLEEQISGKISRRILSGDQGMSVWWSIAAGVHVGPQNHSNEQIVWMLKGKMEFRVGSEQ